VITPTVRRWIPAIALAASSLLLAGCFSAEQRISISDHGTADVEVSTAIDLDQVGRFAQMLGLDQSLLDSMTGQQLLDQFSEGQDPCGDLVGTLTGYDVQTREINEGSKRGIACTVSDVPIAELSAFGIGTSLTIDQDDTGTRFDMTIDGGLPAESAQMTDLLGMSFEDLFDVKFVVSAPGRLTDSNATSTDGGTATWQLTPDAEFMQGSQARLFASWEPASSISDSWGVALGVIVLAGLVGGGIVAAVALNRSDRRRRDAGVS
jgi:hypothetical protein